MANESGSKLGPWVAGGVLVVIGGGLLLWLAAPREEQLPAAAHDTSMPAETNAPAGGPPESAAAATTPGRIVAPRTVLPENGRLTVKLADLREGDVYALGLAMPDEARGDAPVATKLIDADRGRVLELEGHAIDGEGTGVRLEIDPEWLQPGQYMVQVKTHEQTHLPLRRFVIQIE